MVKKALVALIAITLAACQLKTYSQASSDTLAQREYSIPAATDMIHLNSIGLIVCGEGAGTAWIADQNVVITAAHVVGDNKECRIGDRTAFLVETDKAADLSVLIVDLGERQTRLKMTCRQPVVGQTYYAVGFAYGERFVVNPVVYRGNLDTAYLKDDVIKYADVYDGVAYPGMSGGPVIDRQGNVVGISVAINPKVSRLFVRSFAVLPVCVG